MLNIEWGAESNGKLPRVFIPNKTITRAPEFAMEDLPLGIIGVLVPEFAVKDLPLGRTLMMMNGGQIISLCKIRSSYYYICP